LPQAQRIQALLESLPIKEIEAERSLVLDAVLINAHHSISDPDIFAAALAAPNPLWC